MEPEDLHAAVHQPGAGVGAGIAVAVLSVDDSLTRTLGEVITADHAIAIAPDATSLAEQIVAVSAGVVLVDASSVHGDVTAVLTRLRTQFPDLVMVAAGGSAHQAQLANMVADGSVYRFLHKPVSAQRARLSLEAALRRHDELRGAAAEIRKAQAAVAASAVATPNIQPKLLAAGAAAVAVLTLVGWWLLREPDIAPVATPAAAAPPAAAQPVAAQPALTPQQDSELVVLLDRAERALQANNLEEAAGLLAAATKIQPDNARLTFLSAQVSKVRERNALSQARVAAARGDYDKAFAALDAADGADRATLTEARRTLSQQQVEDRLRNYLRLARERLGRGAIVEPVNDNARYYAQAARTLAPGNVDAQRLLQQVTDRVVQDARSAAGRGDTATTERLLAVAREDAVAGNLIDSVRRTLADARAAQRNAELNRLTAQVRQRIAQGRLVEPADDSAQFWLQKLRALEGADAVAAELSAQLAARLLGDARGALERNDFENSQRLLRAAETVAGRTTDSSALAADITAREEKVRRDNAVIGVSALKRTRFIEPTYPPAALSQKISGWVDLEFTVRADGTVANIQIVNAQPGGLFDDAARNALARWRFEPVVRDGQTVDQRAKLRLRFNAPQ